MSWNDIGGNWKQFEGEMQTRWGLLSEDELSIIEGKRGRLEGRIHERYGDVVRGIPYPKTVSAPIVAKKTPC